MAEGSHVGILGAPKALQCGEKALELAVQVGQGAVDPDPFLLELLCVLMHPALQAVKPIHDIGLGHGTVMVREALLLLLLLVVVLLPLQLLLHW